MNREIGDIIKISNSTAIIIDRKDNFVHFIIQYNNDYNEELYTRTDNFNIKLITSIFR